MTNVFLSFLETSISISLIIAVLLLITPFLNKQYAVKWKYRMTGQPAFEAETRIAY